MQGASPADVARADVGAMEHLLRGFHDTRRATWQESAAPGSQGEVCGALGRSGSALVAAIGAGGGCHAGGARGSKRSTAT